MTAHETALARHLAGGPVALENAEHLRDCPACRQELAALRAIESSLRRAKPEFASILTPPPSQVVRHQPLRRMLVGAAAAALFVGTLGVAWLGGRGDEIPTTPDEPHALVSLSTAEDSTFALLFNSDRSLQEQPSSEEIADYLETHWGG